MKWIKTYEELSPETYRKVADEFLKMNKNKKYNDLSNHADISEYGSYNIVYRTADKNQRLVYKNAICTNPSISISYGSSYTTDKEDAINNWVKGDDTLRVNMKVNFNCLKGTEDIQWLIPFDICITLSQWTDGKKEYIEEFYNNDISNISIYSFFEETKYFDIWLKSGSKHLEGLFSDRKSASKFKKILPDLIKDAHDYILDLLGIVGGSAKDFENILDMVRNIKVHNLYDDEIYEENKQKYVPHDWYKKSLI